MKTFSLPELFALTSTSSHSLFVSGFQYNIRDQAQYKDLLEFNATLPEHVTVIDTTANPQTTLYEKISNGLYVVREVVASNNPDSAMNAYIARLLKRKMAIERREKAAQVKTQIENREDYLLAARAHITEQHAKHH